LVAPFLDPFSALLLLLLNGTSIWLTEKELLLLTADLLHSHSNSRLHRFLYWVLWIFGITCTAIKKKRMGFCQLDRFLSV